MPPHLDQFLSSPWQNSHNAYEGSTFNIRPAPEFATAEVMVASLYRSIGFAPQSEKSVPAAGRAFDKSSQRAAGVAEGPRRIDPATWQTVLQGVLDSPKQPNQSSKRFLQLTPVVPDVALYSGSARLSGNSWNPGFLIRRMIQIGSLKASDAQQRWDRLFEALTVGDSDDIWARWLQAEFERRRRDAPAWEMVPLEDDVDLPAEEKAALRFPAQQFVADLDAVVGAKHTMTRRQWVSLLEAVIRLGAVSHVLWLCDVNDRLWKLARKVVMDASVAPVEVGELMTSVVTRQEHYLSYGNPALPRIRDWASSYLKARLGLNLLLWHLESMAPQRSLNSCQDLTSFVSTIRKNREALVAGGFTGQLSTLFEEQTRTIACKKGIGSNLAEFGRYVLGQRQTANDSLRSYDQGYILKKKADYLAAPWVVSLGPVAVLALVHCCLKEVDGPRSIQRFCDHVGSYGLDVDRDDVLSSDLGRNLRMLGLVLDSPDAESGMLLVPPFQSTSRKPS